MSRRFPLMVLVAGVAACTAPGRLEPVISDHVFVIDRDVEMTVEDDRLLFPRAGNHALLARQPGDILVSSRGTGFLCRVVAVDADDASIVIHTEPAELTDALLQGDIVHNTETDGKADWFGADGKADWLGAIRGYANFGNFSFEDSLGFSFRVVKGELHFDPDIDVALRIQNAEQQDRHVIVKGQLDMDLEVEVETAGAVSYSLQEDLPRELFTPLRQVYNFMVGGLPVVLVVDFTIGYGGSLSALTAGVTRLSSTLHTTVTAGFRYRNGEIEWVGDGQLQWVPIRTEGLEFNIEANLYATLDFRFYDLAGPFVAAYPYAGKSFDYEPGYYGLEIVGGGHLLWKPGDPKNELGVIYTLFDGACRLDRWPCEPPPSHFAPIPRRRGGGRH